ncbi:MAG: hypothetical protein E6H76_13580 [Betaproteobacteria bacterium]|nr:MAG: hypothetical protein E6H76_13580 [Betaproteobacteria bacterium]
MEIRHRELAQAAVHRIAIAQLRAVVLGNRAPMPPAAEQREDVRKIARVAVHEHHERRLAVDPQRAGGDERALDAVRAALPQDLPHRQYRLAADLVISRDRVDEQLDLLRRVEPPQDRKFGAREPQVLAAGALSAHAQSHASISYAVPTTRTVLATP